MSNLHYSNSFLLQVILILLTFLETHSSYNTVTQLLILKFNLKCVMVLNHKPLTSPVHALFLFLMKRLDVIQCYENLNNCKFTEIVLCV